MEVSWNRGTPYSSSISRWDFPCKPSILVIPHLWKPPYEIIENQIQKPLSPPALAAGFARPFCSILGASSAIDSNLKPTSTKTWLEIVLHCIFVLYVCIYIYGYGMLYPRNPFCSLHKNRWDLWIHPAQKLLNRLWSISICIPCFVKCNCTACALLEKMSGE